VKASFSELAGAQVHEHFDSNAKISRNPANHINNEKPKDEGRAMDPLHTITGRS
jgi:hypothetical protein